MLVLALASEGCVSLRTGAVEGPAAGPPEVAPSTRDVVPGGARMPAPRAHDNTATLRWEPPASAATLAGYRVYYGFQPGRYLQRRGRGIRVGNITTYTVTGLRSGSRYYFAVTAADQGGRESSYSNEVLKDIP
jgi:hypothetical protein